MFSWRCSIHETAPFLGGERGGWEGSGPGGPEGSQPEVVFHKTNTASEQSFKITCLSRNGTYPKLTVLVHFWAQFIPGRLKILPKTKFPQKLHPYDYQITQVSGPR